MILGGFPHREKLASFSLVGAGRQTLLFHSFSFLIYIHGLDKFITTLSASSKETWCTNTYPSVLLGPYVCVITRAISWILFETCLLAAQINGSHFVSIPGGFLF